MACCKQQAIDFICHYSMNEDSDNKISLVDVLKSTLMSFFGVQKESVRQRDFSSGSAIHFIVMGVIVAIVLVCSLIVIVKLILL